MACETIFFITTSNDSTWGVISFELQEVNLRSSSGQPSSLARMAPVSVLRVTLSLARSAPMARSQSERPGLDLLLGFPSTRVFSLAPRLASRSPRTSWGSRKKWFYHLSKNNFSHQVFFREIVNCDIFQVYLKWFCIQLRECYQDPVLVNSDIIVTYKTNPHGTCVLSVNDDMLLGLLLFQCQRMIIIHGTEKRINNIIYFQL